MLVIGIFVAIITVCTSLVQGDNTDKITDLPGVPYKIDFDQYAGYLNASNNGYRRKYFYWLTEAQGSDADTKPLALWLTGGPGCSSLVALLEEIGPFRPNPGGKSLYENKYSWNKAANVLFLESPAGVGYSVDLDNNVQSDDNQVARDNYQSLLSFYEKFPKYTTRPLFVFGESYGGIYVPTLSALIVKENVEREANNETTIPFKGFSVGNGMLSFKDQANSAVDLLYYRGEIGYDEYVNVTETCCPDLKAGERCDYGQNLTIGPGPAYVSDNSSCGDHVRYLNDDIVMNLKTNDYYNEYQNCYKGSGSSYKVASLRATLQYKFRYPELVYADVNLKQPDLARLINYDSTDNIYGFGCYVNDNGTATYMNRPDVKKAIHAPETKWEMCSDAVGDKYEITHLNVSAEFETVLTQSDARILVYNGDVDSACNFLGDQWFVKRLVDSMSDQIEVTEERQPWLFRNQIAGYAKRYTRLDQLTVKGAGHLVPMDRAGPAFQMITNFIKNSTTYSDKVPYDLSLKPLILQSSAAWPRACVALVLCAILHILY